MNKNQGRKWCVQGAQCESTEKGSFGAGEVVRETAGRREVTGVLGEYSCSPGEHFGPHYMKLSLQTIQKNH